MLTWAIAWHSVRMKGHNGLWFVIAMGCDVAIFYWIAQAVIASR